jgi:trk system potassium uptake protein TrkH
MRFDAALLTRPLEGRRRLWGRASGVQLFVLSFAGLVLGGTLGLLVLPGLYTGPRLGIIDALFTAASAVCVTGLIVVDTARYFTFWGQAWILLLIQAGGLGILTFATLIIRVLGRRSALGLESAAGTGVAARIGDTGAMVRAVFLLTFGIEAVGATVLWLVWRGPLGAGPAVWHAVFHAISAFCNAGFSTFSDNLVGWRSSPPVLLSVGGLVLLGGIGFVVLEDVRARLRRGGTRRLATHSRIALLATGVTVAVAAVLFFGFEGAHTLRGLTAGDRVTNALFMAITPRTAGFNTVDYSAVSNASYALTIGLMFVGGSPGGTAGGVKTTTASVLLLLLVARLRGRRHVAVVRHTVPEDVLQAAAGLVVGAVAILSVGVFLLLLSEPAVAAADRAGLARLVFEANSAFGTVGLSMSKTPELTPSGRVIITLLMFVGRVGPLSLAAAMATGRERRAPHRYAYDNVAIG